MAINFHALIIENDLGGNGHYFMGTSKALLAADFDDHNIEYIFILQSQLFQNWLHLLTRDAIFPAELG